MRLIDADAFDNVLKDAQTECKKTEEISDLVCSIT